jgi:SsrA-binding protein
VKKNRKKVVIKNPKAYRYKIFGQLEAGLVLSGAEVKAIRTRGMELSQAIIQIKNGEAWLVNAFIPSYQYATDRPHEPRSARKLLLKKGEIATLLAKKREKLTIIPLSCYTRGRWIKLRIGLVRPKKKRERKQELIARELEREAKERFGG